MAKMVTLLITSFFILAILAIAIYFWQKPGARTETPALPNPPGRALFTEDTPDQQFTRRLAAEEKSDAIASAAAKRFALVERSGGGLISTLLDAYKAREDRVYDEALNALVDEADTDAKLLALVSQVTTNELRINRKLAERIIESYKRAPDRGGTARMLHISALSDDAAVYQSAVETALKFWRAGQLPEISAPELCSILDAEFWVLSSPTRSSGAGFLLKRTLASARRELEAARNG